MDFIKCSEMRYGTALNIVTCVDFFTDFVCEENISYKTLQFTVSRSYRIDAGVFILCLKGTITLMLNMDKYVMKENDIIVFLPHNFIKVNTISPDTIISFIGFSSEIIKDGDFFKTFHQSVPDLYNSPVLSLSAGMTSFFQQSFTLWSGLQKIPEIAMDKHMIKDVMYTAFHTILCLCKQGIGVNKIEKNMIPQDSHYMARTFVQLTMQYYSSEHSLAFYANKMNISVPNLCRIVRTRIGKTPLEVISSFIFIDAQTQLKTTNRPIKSIANSLGFANSTVFCRFFRKNAQISPLEYRNGTIL